MPVAIAGMHRSGTSMVAHALHLAGMWFGEDAELYSASADNADGYWEHAGFVGVNDALLAELGGGWDRPPAVPSSFADPRVRPLRRDARKLLAAFEGREPWAWKDPRNSLTLPLWLDLVPELRVVVCVRHPLEVALSLHRRFVSYSTALELWRTYMAAIVERVPPEQRLLTDYARWFSRPAAEARRVLGFAGVETTRATVARAKAAVRADLRHHAFTERDLLGFDVSPDVVELYAGLLGEAHGGTAVRSAPPAAPSGRIADVRRLDAEVQRRRADSLAAVLEKTTEALERSLAVEREERARREESGRVAAELRRRMAELDRLPETIDGHLRRHEAALRESEIERREDAEQRWAALAGRLEDRLDSIHGAIYDLQLHAPDAHDPDYRRLVRAVRETVRENVPVDATVLVVSRGDEDLVRLYGRRAWHFPRARDGKWLGYHPKSSLPAIAQLEALRAHGADHLLLPASTLWWLEEYRDFARHLESRYSLRTWEDGVCAIYTLGDEQDAEASARRQLADFVEDFRLRFGRDPALVDWHTGLDLSRTLAGGTAFAPPADGNGLPYLDDTIDVVVLRGSDPSALAEARRVATAGVVSLAAELEPLEVEWQPGATNGGATSVSIVIPCYDGVEHTRACLTSLQETLPRSAQAEILAIDDASTDGTAELLQAFASDDDRITVLRNDRNLGFLGSAARGAAEARHHLLVFLNNDTIPLPGWLVALIRAFAENPDAGVVGGRLLYPDGRLQEAGGLVFSDGSAWKFGYGDPDPEGPLFATPREVDYCSGCLLATPTALFRELGGFDRRFEPGFYEDTDYCFRVRQHGLKVYYEPASMIVHVEGATAGTDLTRGPKLHQALNHEKFARKWRRELRDQPDRPAVLDPETLVQLVADRAALRTTP